MKKSRKLAWVVLGVVVLGVVGLFVQLSYLYSSWEPTTYNAIRFVNSWWENSPLPTRYSPLYLRNQGREFSFGDTLYGKTCQQRFRWMPGEDVVSVLITRKEWLELKMKAGQ